MDNNTIFGMICALIGVFDIVKGWRGAEALPKWARIVYFAGGGFFLLLGAALLSGKFSFLA